MMKYILTLGFVVGGVVAAGSKDSTTPSLPSPVIPSGISSSCTSFLESLDSNTALTTCLKALNGATTLQTLCASSISSACPASLFKTQLASLSTACDDELGGGSPNPTVLLVYDTLFAAFPFQEAVCAQDASTGGFCVDTLTSASSATGSAPITGLASIIATAKTYLASSIVISPASYKRAAPATQVTFPNTTTFTSLSLPFVFLTPSSPASVLCTPCAQKILKTYIDYETGNPYTIGINGSPLLGKQNAIYSAMTGQCGDAFSGGVVANAGAAPNATVAQGSLASSATGRRVAAGAAFALGGGLLAMMTL